MREYGDGAIRRHQPKRLPFDTCRLDSAKKKARRVAATESAYTLAQFNSNADIYCADTPLSYNVLLLNVVYSVSRSFTKRRRAHYLKQEEEEYIYCGGGYIEGQMELPISHQKETKKVECRCFVTPTDAGAACAPSSRAEFAWPRRRPFSLLLYRKRTFETRAAQEIVFFLKFRRDEPHRLGKRIRQNR